MNTLTVNRRKYMVPSRFDELDIHQWRAYISYIYNRKAIFSVEKKRSGRVEVKIHDHEAYMIAHMAMLKAMLYKCRIKFEDITPAQLHDMIFKWELTKFVFEPNAIKNPLPVVKTGRWPWNKKLYGPVNGFDQLTAEEFSYADYFYTRYEDTGNYEHLVTFVEVLYRPHSGQNSKAPGFSGDVRVPFNKHLLGSNPAISRLSKTDMLVVLVWYKAYRRKLPAKYPFVFKASEGSNKTPGTFMDVVFGLAGGKFGTLPETGKTGILMVLKECNRLSEEAEELKSKFKT